MVAYVHSCPTWIAGPRKAHPKFGGPVIEGIEMVSDRLTAIHEAFPDDYTSGHLLLEIKTELEAYHDLNSPNAIDWDELVNGIMGSRFPKIAALTTPAFGLPDSHMGSILSSDPLVCDRTYALHREAIQKSTWLKERGLGLGKVIWWMAFDAITRWMSVPREEAWQRFKEFWVILLNETGGELQVEWKPSVPGDADYLPTLALAIQFANKVNEALGRKAVFINNEWAHLLIGGMTVEEGTRQTFEAGLFDGFVHVNSAELAIIKYTPEGVVIEGTPGDDKDWKVGEGGEERWNDQQEAVGVILSSGVEPIVFEHDLDPSGIGPIAYYTRSRFNLDTMIAAVIS